MFGDVVTFSCSPGYLRVGPTELLCRGDGQFSGSAPSCESNLGSLNLVRYRALFLASFGEGEGVSQLAYQEADTNRDGLVSEAWRKTSGSASALVCLTCSFPQQVGRRCHAPKPKWS